MSRGKHSEAEMIAALTQVEVGRKVKNVARGAHIQPGKPTQSVRVERIHGKMREECLQVSWFRNLFDAQRKIGGWRRDYNELRPHSSLGDRTPCELGARHEHEEIEGLLFGVWLPSV